MLLLSLLSFTAIDESDVETYSKPQKLAETHVVLISKHDYETICILKYLSE